MTQREFLIRRIWQIAMQQPTSDAGRRAQAEAMAELERELPRAGDLKVVGAISPEVPYGERVSA